MKDQEQAKAFPSETFTEARTKYQLKKVNIVDSFVDRRDIADYSCSYIELDIPTSFKEHLEVIENRMRDNGYNIKIHVPDDIIDNELQWLEDLNRCSDSDSDAGSFDLGALMEGTYFLPLITSAVIGTIKNGEFAVFESEEDGGIVLRENHKIDDRFLPEPAIKLERTW
ncbi:hypothetical protein FVER53590_26518 [Fusarium verticillioides]|nr:hypothetical protein FVER53590_26518 [Fusarium verticillioides]